jgi:hypothetical protein
MEKRAEMQGGSGGAADGLQELDPNMLRLELRLQGDDAHLLTVELPLVVSEEPSQRR